MGPDGTPYCTRADLVQYMPPAFLALFPTSVQDQACLDASSEADSYMNGRYQMPLLAWGFAVRMHTAWIAIYLLAQQVGFAPQAGSDRLITERFYASTGWPDKPGTGWFPGIQRQSIHPDVTPSVATGQDPKHDLPQVRTSQTRGWEQTSNGKPVV